MLIRVRTHGQGDVVYSLHLPPPVGAAASSGKATLKRLCVTWCLRVYFTSVFTSVFTCSNESKLQDRQTDRQTETRDLAADDHSGKQNKTGAAGVTPSGLYHRACRTTRLVKASRASVATSAKKEEGDRERGPHAARHLRRSAVVEERMDACQTPLSTLKLV